MHPRAGRKYAALVIISSPRSGGPRIPNAPVNILLSNIGEIPGAIYADVERNGMRRMTLNTTERYEESLSGAWLEAKRIGSVHLKEY